MHVLFVQDNFSEALWNTAWYQGILMTSYILWLLSNLLFQKIMDSWDVRY